MTNHMAPQQSYRSSALSRNAAKVFDAAQREPILVTRRDGENLVLMSESEARERTQLLELAAQLVAIDCSSEAGSARSLADRLPWMLALSDEDRRQCTGDLIRAARASFSTGRAHLAVAEMASWRETAENVAAGFGAIPVSFLNEPVPVERPS